MPAYQGRRPVLLLPQLLFFPSWGLLRLPNSKDVMNCKFLLTFSSKYGMIGLNYENCASAQQKVKVTRDYLVI